jgi:mono/diheme cytochrome c family protein
MQARSLIVAMGSIILALAGPNPAARAQEFGDPAKGLSYAESHCAECHAVRLEDEISPAFGAPTFAAIANTRGMTERAIGVWFRSSHPTMPMLVVPKEDLDNVIAYVMSLKGKGLPVEPEVE